MQEDIFKLNYFPYLKKEKKLNFGKIKDKLSKNKFVISLLITIILASSINIILMYNFLKLLETLA